MADVRRRSAGPRARAASGDLAGMHASLVSEVPAILYRCVPDDDGTTVFVSPQIEDALGYPVGEWLSQNDMWSELLHPDDRERVLAQWDRCREEGIVFDSEYRMIGSDGRRAWFHDRGRGIVGEDGVLYWQGIMVDITAARAREERLEEEAFFLNERVRAQQEKLDEADALIDLEVMERNAITEDLRESEARFAALKARLRSSWMYTWDVVDGRATGGFNDEATLLEFGADPAEVALEGDAYWRRYFHPADSERIAEKIRRSTTEGVPFEDSYRWVTPDGRVRWILDRAMPTAWDPVERRGTFVGLMVDVSDLMGSVSPEA